MYNSISINFDIFRAKVAKKFPNNTKNVNRNNENQSNVHKTLNLDNCVENTNFRKLFSCNFTEFSDIFISNHYNSLKNENQKSLFLFHILHWTGF